MSYKAQLQALVESGELSPDKRADVLMTLAQLDMGEATHGAEAVAEKTAVNAVTTATVGARRNGAIRLDMRKHLLPNRMPGQPEHFPSVRQSAAFSGTRSALRQIDQGLPLNGTLSWSLSYVNESALRKALNSQAFAYVDRAPKKEGQRRQPLYATKEDTVYEYHLQRANRSNNGKPYVPARLVVIVDHGKRQTVTVQRLQPRGLR